jgi:hypothetical protein
MIDKTDTQHTAYEQPKTGVTVQRWSKPDINYPQATDFGMIGQSLRISQGELTIALFAEGAWESMDYHPTAAELEGHA